MKIHEKYIKRCIQIAKNGLGKTAPNPMVGCVIVHHNTIIGEGFTSPYGESHAEVNAIQSVKEKSLLKDATLYVTLEPCSHHGKTPPCSDLIVSTEIPNVVIGCQDDNPEVSGKGIEKLKASGCHVIFGILEQECRQHHKRFFTYHNKKRPYIILKWAETSDGFIAPQSKNEQAAVWITNSISRQLVHKWRSEEQAILVGTKTVIDDNPSLTTRDHHGTNPIRYVIDEKKHLSRAFKIFNNESETVTLSEETIDFKMPIGIQIAQTLYKNKITSVIIEGGRKTLQTFLDEDLWDEARVFIGTKAFQNGTKAPCISGHLVDSSKILSDTLNIYYND